MEDKVIKKMEESINKIMDEGITTNNLAYSLKNESLEIGFRSGSSNHVSEDGIVEITYTEGFLLMMECFD